MIKERPLKKSWKRKVQGMMIACAHSQYLEKPSKTLWKQLIMIGKKAICTIMWLNKIIKSIFKKATTNKPYIFDHMSYSKERRKEASREAFIKP